MTNAKTAPAVKSTAPKMDGLSSDADFLKLRNSIHTDRHGTVRYRYRKAGVTVALGTDYGSDDFIKRFNAAVKGERAAPRQATGKVLSGSVPGSLSTVIDGWYKSSAFTRLGVSTQYNYRNTLEALRKLHGDKTVQNLQRRHIKDIMSKKVHIPNSANQDLRMLRLVLDYAIDMEIVKVNEARGVRKFSVSDVGHHTWTEAEIAAYYAKHLPGTVAHTAMTLMLNTGAARSDVCALGWYSIVDGRLSYSRKKMATRNGIVVSIPIHPDLAKCIAALPKEHPTFLHTDKGTQRSPGGLSNLMRGWCDIVGLSECSSHGLRKACARRLIEAGATPHEMMAVTGHKTLAEAQRYAETFDRSSAADRALQKQSNG